MSAICDFLQQRLETGDWRLGQALVREDFTIRHVDDVLESNLEVLMRPEDAR